MTKKVAVIGAGGWGTATAGLLAEKGMQVIMVSHNADHLKTLQTKRESLPFLPGYKLPKNLEVTLDGHDALAKAELVLSAVPTKYLRKTWNNLGPAVAPRIPIVSLSKGIENKTFQRPSEIIAEYVSDNPVAVLSGPSHAEEVAKHMPTTVAIAAKNSLVAAQLQEDFATPNFRVYTNSDLFGVEFGGAMKNVVSLAAGMVDGLGFGDNTKAALLTRGLNEIITLGCALGAKRKTFYGMSGVGDLITTAFSPFGRNRAVGERIGKGETLTEILASTQKVAEGIWTTKSIHNLAKKMGIEMPITTEVYRVLFRRKDPRRAVTQLMMRAGKGE